MRISFAAVVASRQFLSSAVGLLLAVLALASTGWAGVSSAKASGPGPLILSVQLSVPHGHLVRAAGEVVVVTVRVRNATSCTFFRQRSTFSSLYPLKTVACASGQASVRVPPIANLYKTRVQLTYAVRARAVGKQPVQRSVRVSQAAATQPSPTTTWTPTTTQLAASPTALLSISPSSVPATGGSIVLNYSSSNASSCFLASTPTLWPGSNPTSVSCNGTYDATLAASTSANQWTFTFTATNSGGRSAASTQTLTELAPTPASSPRLAQSTIWSGYVVPSSSAPVTQVSGAWTVPALNCSVTPNGGAASWVGIGGQPWPTGGTSGTLLQTGVQTDCVNGLQQNNGWFEEYPSNPNFAKTFASFPVSPGDSIKASVYESSDGVNWETRVDDLTTGLSGVMVTGQGWGVLADAGNGTFPKQGSTAGLSYSGGYTAEWIVEDNMKNGSIVPFADYGTVNFTNLTTSLTAWRLATTEGVEIVQNGVVLSSPSSPSGSGFSVSYTG